MMIWTELPNKTGTVMTQRTGSWLDLTDRIKTVGAFPSKEACPWLKVAAFGATRTRNGSLRHDANLRAVYGIEGDYDGGMITMDDALAMLERHSIRAALYPSPSSTAEKPRWRVIAPLAREHPPGARAALLARLNGALGGVLAGESFTSSQGYYFGATPGNDYRVLITFNDPDDGFCIDDLDDLDSIAIGKPTTASKATPGQTGERMPIGAEMFSAAVRERGRLLKDGDGRREMLKSFIASRSARSLPPGDIRAMVRGIAAEYFDPGDPMDEQNIAEIVQHFAAKDHTAPHFGPQPGDDFEADSDDDGVRVHPLAQFVDLAGEVKPPRWVIPGFIAQGVVVIAGAHGVGKSTALLPLAMVAAGLHGEGDALAPRHWRHVVYITEDVEQARRILAGIVGWGGLGLDMGTVGERLHIVEARRLEPAFVVQVSNTYREQFTRTVDGVEVLPLVVVDTKSAVLAQGEENDNTEGSEIMAYLKQDFQGLPVWVIGHVSKANLNRSNASELSMRGGSAFEADAHQVLYLVKEADERRYLVRGKTRFEAEWAELQIQSKTAATLAHDEFGNLETLVMRWGIAAPPEQSRKEASEQAAEQQRKEDEAALRDEVRDAVATAWHLGNPLNRAGVKAKVRRKALAVTAMIEILLSERWLHEVQVPAKVRAVNSKAAFLVSLTTEEHEAVLSGAGLPAAKLVIPESWQKQANPLVPEPLGGAEEVDHA